VVRNETQNQLIFFFPWLQNSNAIARSNSNMMLKVHGDLIRPCIHGTLYFGKVILLCCRNLSNLLELDFQVFEKKI
jgi:hypothetical protein